MRLLSQSEVNTGIFVLMFMANRPKIVISIVFDPSIVKVTSNSFRMDRSLH